MSTTKIVFGITLCALSLLFLSQKYNNAEAVDSNLLTADHVSYFTAQDKDGTWKSGLFCQSSSTCFQNGETVSFKLGLINLTIGQTYTLTFTSRHMCASGTTGFESLYGLAELNGASNSTLNGISVGGVDDTYGITFTATATTAEFAFSGNLGANASSCVGPYIQVALVCDSTKNIQIPVPGGSNPTPSVFPTLPALPSMSPFPTIILPTFPVQEPTVPVLPTVTTAPTLTPSQTNFTLGAAKRVMYTTYLGGNRFRVKYEVLIKNYNSEIATKVQVSENLQDTYHDLDFKVKDLYSPDFTVNTKFDGDHDRNMLKGEDSIGAGKEGKIYFEVEVVVKEERKEYKNYVVVSGTYPNAGAWDKSQNGTNPDPDDDKNPNNNNEETPITLDINTPVEGSNTPTGSSTGANGTGGTGGSTLGVTTVVPSSSTSTGKTLSMRFPDKVTPDVKKATKPKGKVLSAPKPKKELEKTGVGTVMLNLIVGSGLFMISLSSLRNGKKTSQKVNKKNTMSFDFGKFLAFNAISTIMRDVQNNIKAGVSAIILELNFLWYGETFVYTQLGFSRNQSSIFFNSVIS